MSLPRWGHNRDGKKGKLQVNYGLLTTRAAARRSLVFKGKHRRPKTLMPQVETAQAEFRLEARLVPSAIADDQPEAE